MDGNTLALFFADALEILIIPAALVVLFVLIKRGSLRRDALADAPPRDVNLNLTDLCVWLLLYFLGALALRGILPSLGIPLSQLDSGESMQPWLLAKLALLGQVFTQVPVVIFLLLRLRSQPDGVRRAGLLPHNPSAEARAAGAALLAAIPLTLGLSAITIWIGQATGHPAPKFGHEMLKVMSESTSRRATAVLLFSVVLVAPLLEEIVFRGLVQTALLNTLGRANRWGVVLIAAAMFDFVHIGSVPWFGLPALLALGIILGWLYEKHGSLLPCILVHMGFNALNAGWTLVFVSPRGPVHGN